MGGTGGLPGVSLGGAGARGPSMGPNVPCSREAKGLAGMEPGWEKVVWVVARLDAVPWAG